MRYLPFASRNREEGLANMRIAIEKGRFLNINAQYGLLAAYINEERYDEALSIAEHLFKNFPDNPTLYYRRGRIFQATERWEDAIEAYEGLFAILEKSELQSLSYQVECLLHLAQSNFEIKNYSETQRLCLLAKELASLVDLSQEIESQFTDFEDITSAIDDIYDEVKSLNLAHVSETN